MRRDVAIKVLTSVNDPGMLARFRSEPATTGVLKHKNGELVSLVLFSLSFLLWAAQPPGKWQSNTHWPDLGRAAPIAGPWRWLAKAWHRMVRLLPRRGEA